MASADLEYIRALLIAQTADPEPARKGAFGRWLSPKVPRRAPPLDLACERPGAARATTSEADADQALLLDRICGPAPGAPPRHLPCPVEDEPDIFVAEAVSPLPPPAPRAEFGRRADLFSEVELMLDQPASEPRRLQVLDVSGQPIGEMILQPDAQSHRAVYAAREEAVPYFPEDLEEDALFRGSEPMRPWIKALRHSGAPQREKPAPTVVEPAPAPPKPAKSHTARRARGRKSSASPPRSPKNPGLDRDLLEALALTLAREHETLTDRLATVNDTGLFV